VSEVQRFVVEEADDGLRLDRYLAARVPDRSRSALARAIREGGVQVGGRKVHAARKLRAGDVVELQPETVELSLLEPQAMPLTILHEDPELIVLDKAPGLVVHPGAGVRDGTLVNGLLAHLGQGLREVGAEGRPGIVHRLDKGTTGVIVVAKTPAAHAELARQFSQREVAKCYLGLALGRPSSETGEIDAPIGRSRGQRTKMAIRPEDGRPALSRYRVREAFGRHAVWLEVEIETGRTHQIRVHLASLGHPLAGDETYGGRRVQSVTEPRLRAILSRLDRPALHAWRLAFTHPASGERVQFEAPLPADLVQVLARLREVCSGP
jgi:23S rRNA pseudouridine1911/1915/1917 synthase